MGSSIKIIGLNSISKVEEDENPKLGGNLDTNGHKIDGSTTNGYLVLRGDSGATDDFKLYDSGILDLPKQSGASAYVSSTQTLSSGDSNISKAVFDSENFDIQNEYDASNYRFTATKTGKYRVTSCLTFWSMTSGDRTRIEIRKNGICVGYLEVRASGEYVTPLIVKTLNLLANDYIEIYVGQYHGSDEHYSGGSTGTLFEVLKIG